MTRARIILALVLGLGLALALSVTLRARHLPVPQSFPTITLDRRSRPEGCLLCHASVRGMGAAHDVARVGCSPCHGGDPSSASREGAHRGVDVLAGDLSRADATCGLAGCHPVETARVQRGAMAGARGILAVDRFAFGERADPTPRDDDDLRALRPDAPARSPAEDHARRLCASCHLGARKTSPGDHGFASRGGGCTACHLARPDLRGARGDGPLHPDLSAHVSPDRCRGCHARSGRVALSYAGEVELEPGDPRVDGRLPDGRPIGHAPADVHARAGMTCVDCHTERDLMGDGLPHAFASESVGVGCDDCHAPRTRALDPDAAAVAARLRASWARRGNAPIPPEAVPLVTAAGVPLWRTDRTSMTLRRDEDGRSVSIPLRRNESYHDIRGHASLTCQACHSAWAPRCGGCHTTFDPARRDVDHLRGVPLPGGWREAAGANGYGPPVLLRDGRGRVATFTEGMDLTIDGIPRPVRRTLWAPLDPHTTSRARACASCHPDGDPDAAYPSRGEATRPGAAVVDPATRARVRAVGRCVPCHGTWGDPIYRDFTASAARVTGGRAARGDDPPARGPCGFRRGGR